MQYRDALDILMRRLPDENRDDAMLANAELFFRACIELLLNFFDLKGM
jgi:hypothetical protein